MTSGEDNSFEFRRIGQHVVRRETVHDPWHIVVDVSGSATWVRCSRFLNRGFNRRVAAGEALDVGAVTSRMVRACVDEPSPCGPTSKSRGARVRLRAGWIVWWLSPPLAFGGPRTVGTSAAQAAQDLALDDLADHRGSAERIEAEAEAGWEQGRARLDGIEQRSAYFLGGVGLGASVLVASSGLLLSDNALGGVARTLATVGLLLTIVSLAISATYSLAATMRAFGRVSPDISARVIERAKERDEEARLQRAARLIAARRRSSYVATWKLARLKRAAVASLGAVFGLLTILMAVVFSI